MNPSPNSRQFPKFSDEDIARRHFLLSLDSAPFDVTDWEAQFIEDLITNVRTFTPAQRRAIDELRTKYEGRLCS